MILSIRDANHIEPMVNRLRDFFSRALIHGPMQIELKPESKSRNQEAKYHSMIADISKTVSIEGRTYTPVVWKALLVDEFEEELRANGEALSKPGKVVVSLDGRRAVSVRPTTTAFLKKEGSDFIQFLYMKGGELGATFTEKSLQHYEEMMQGRC
jgi:hypothetical protein